MTNPKYPDGKLGPDDEGALGALVYVKENRVFIDFGTDLSWIALPKEGAQALVDMIQSKIDKLT